MITTTATNTTAAGNGVPPLGDKIDAHLLVIVAPYYESIAAELLAGAEEEITGRGATFEVVRVTGALEIPQGLLAAVDAAVIPRQASEGRFDGALALGCVIRGETAHYDVVVENSNRALMQIAIDEGIPLGNAILTVDTMPQAEARASGGRAGKGGDAARACLGLIALRRQLRGGTAMTAADPRAQKPRPPAQAARSAARMGAVQALYQMDLAGTEVTEVIREFTTLRFPGLDKDDPVAGADPTFFAELLRGVVDRQRELDPLVDQQLASGWRLVRIDSTLRAILRSGAFELMDRLDVPARVVINEYIDVAHAFFNEDEPKVVNGVLDRLAHRLRPGEFDGVPPRSGRPETGPPEKA